MATKMKTLTINDVTYDITDDSTVSFVEEQHLTEEQKAQARANIGVDTNSVLEPADDDIPKAFFGNELPQTKDETVMPFRYISKTADISGYCKTKAQGDSSLAYPKKNQTVKLYKDAECTEKLKVDFKGWGEQNKFCFKANWIDLTHARNVVSARLWGDVVESRSNYAEIPELLRTSPNHGAVNGFPVKVYANGIYQGRYTINIPKDAWMANMDDTLDAHCILCGESNYNNISLFRALAGIGGYDWSDEIHDTVPESIKARWNEIITFVMNATDDEFVAGIGDYFDVASLIDYYLFGLVSCNLDGFGKNQLYMTYDGQKWFATVYDLDSTWGLWWNGEQFVTSTYGRSVYQDFLDCQGPGRGNLLYIRVANLFAGEVIARWEELRNGALSVENIVNRFERFTDICPPWLVEEDYADTTVDGAFTGIPSKLVNNIQQIRSYAKKRVDFVSEYLGEKNEIDYTINPLAGITWHINSSYNWDSGNYESTNSEHCTEKFKLQDCVYTFSFSAGGSWGALYVWDENGNYVNRKEEMYSDICFTANSKYSYAVKVYQESTFDSSKVTVTPKDNRETMADVGVVYLEELEWEIVDGYLEADATGVFYAQRGTTDCINNANVSLLLLDEIHAKWRFGDKSDDFFGSLVVFNRHVYIRTNMFSDVDTAVAFFKANKTKIVFNK